MKDQQIKSAPMPTVRRLPSYLRFLKLLQAKNREFVSCTHIAAELGLDPTQIRKDLSSAGAHGTPKIGYQVDTLIAAIESFLGWDDPTYAFLVGANGVAESLMESPDMQQRCGLDVLAVFDTDSERIGAEIAGKEILAVEKLPDLAHRMHVHIGILAVPGPQAQEMANTLIASGVKAIWNFTHEKIDVPEDVTLENLDIAASMAALSAKRAVAELIKS
jgi:redox-sensing transcriptional repressor